MHSWYQPLPLKSSVAKVQTAQGVTQCLMEPVNSGVCGWCGIAPCEWDCCQKELWLTAGRVQRKLVHQKCRSKVLRQVLGRHYLYLSDGSFQGAIPPCVASNLNEYWPDERSKV
ncbi:hypothetical protein GQ600_27134 [Phytophthora cactorum]|nr:hypothetical protein GQ600_27134 [Phytophthora cactorum]